MIPGSLKEQVLNHLDIAAFYRKELHGLKNGHGDEATAFCPFHDDQNTPNFFVNLKTGRYNCFACPAKGNIFTFYQTRHNCDFKAALHDLAQLAGVDEPDTQHKSLTLLEFAKAKKFDPTFLAKHGVFQATGKGGPYLVFIYRDREGRNQRKRPFSVLNG